MHNYPWVSFKSRKKVDWDWNWRCLSEILCEDAVLSREKMRLISSWTAKTGWKGYLGKAAVRAALECCKKLRKRGKLKAFSGFHPIKQPFDPMRFYNLYLHSLRMLSVTFCSVDELDIKRVLLSWVFYKCSGIFSINNNKEIKKMK